MRILVGDVLERLRDLPDESVHCVVTSPPYWGLRDYGVEGQIGLEATPQEYVEKMVEVFREVRRVLRSDGTAWVNLGDSYSGSGPSGASYQSNTTKRRASGDGVDGPFRVSRTLGARGLSYAEKKPIPPPGLKRKDLVGIPWRVAFALQADGWYLRQDIIWAKPNPMPESVRDRCTKSHEYIFLLSKSARYYFDADAIAEPASPNTHARLAQDVEAQIGSARAHAGGKTNGPMKAVARGKSKVGAFGVKNNPSFASAVCLRVPNRNKRDVWTITTKPYKEAHFATFPPELPEICIKAGCPLGGVVLDPFGGAGTTGLVADRLGRDSILIELNPEYAALAERRIRGDAPLFAAVGTD
jgi:DNA modification methylase